MLWGIRSRNPESHVPFTNIKAKTNENDYFDNVQFVKSIQTPFEKTHK